MIAGQIGLDRGVWHGEVKSGDPVVSTAASSSANRRASWLRHCTKAVSAAPSGDAFALASGRPRPASAPTNCRTRSRPSRCGAVSGICSARSRTASTPATSAAFVRMCSRMRVRAAAAAGSVVTAIRSRATRSACRVSPAAASACALAMATASACSGEPARTSASRSAACAGASPRSLRTTRSARAASSGPASWCSTSAPVRPSARSTPAQASCSTRRRGGSRSA